MTKWLDKKIDFSYYCSRRKINLLILRVMKKNRLFFFLILVTSFLLPSSYAGYNDIIEADFLTHGTKYEAQDMEDLVCDKQNVVAVISHALSTFIFIQDLFFGPLSGFSFPTPLTHSISSVLRC